MTVHSIAECPAEQAVLTGYIDGVLTQGDRQRVRLHLEGCSDCRRLVEELCEIRELARSTRFRALTDDQWDETPRSLLSRWTRNVGLSVLLVWAIAILVIMAVLPDEVSNSLVGRLLIWAMMAGWISIFVSVAMDRLATARTDIYRRVSK